MKIIEGEEKVTGPSNGAERWAGQHSCIDAFGFGFQVSRPINLIHFILMTFWFADIFETVSNSVDMLKKTLGDIVS